MTPPARDVAIGDNTQLSLSLVKGLLWGLIGLTVTVGTWLLRIETHVSADEYRQASYQASISAHEVKLSQFEKDVTEIKVNIANMAGQAGIKYEIVRKPSSSR